MNGLSRFFASLRMTAKKTLDSSLRWKDGPLTLPSPARREGKPNCKLRIEERTTRLLRRTAPRNDTDIKRAILKRVQDRHRTAMPLEVKNPPPKGRAERPAKAGSSSPAGSFELLLNGPGEGFLEGRFGFLLISRFDSASPWPSTS